MSKRGAFICIEGIDASGKTTQAKILVRNLKRKRIDAIYTTEPSKGKIGKLIRQHVLAREKRVPVALEALLFAADRLDHLESEVEPALEKRRIIVCDRYVYSSLAYQGAADLSRDWIQGINQFAVVPDLAIFLDVSPEVVLKRLKRKRTVMENSGNLQKVREVYLGLVTDEKMIMIEGDKPVKDVAEDILKLVLEFLERLNILQKQRRDIPLS